MRRCFITPVITIMCLGLCLLAGCGDDGTSPKEESQNPTDMEHAWSKGFGDAATQQVRAVVTDASGNVIIAGYFKGTLNFGGNTLTCEGQEDIYVAKFAPDGTHLWSDSFGDASDQYAFSVAVDASGNVFLAGRFWGTVDFGGGPLTSAGTSDVYLVKFSSGGTHLWSKSFGDSSTDEAYALATDADGNIFMLGKFYGSIDFGGGPLTSSGYSDIFLAKFDPDGNHDWSDHYGDGDSDYASDVAIDGSGNVIIVGEFYSSVDFGGGTLSSAGGPDIYVAKFGSDGSYSWSDSYGDSEDQTISSVAVDASGDVIIAGYFEGTVDFGGDALTSTGQSDILIAKFSSGGTHIWSKRFGDSSRQLAYGLATDPSGNIFMSGFFQGNVDFGGGVLTTAGVDDVFMARFGPSGSHMWSGRFGDWETQFSMGVAADASGNGIIIGSFESTIDFGGDELTSAGSLDIFVAKFE